MLKLHKTDVSVKEHLRESFPYKRPLRQDQFSNKIKSGPLFSYVQCDIKTPDHQRDQSASFLPFIKKTNVFRQDFGSISPQCAKKEWLLTQPRRMIVSSLELINGTIITPMLLFNLGTRIVWTKVYRFTEYTPVKRFDIFVQSVVNARCQRDENISSSVVAETLKLLANNSYGYQIIDCSRHSITRYMNGERTRAAVNNNFFKRSGHTNDQLYEVELV